MEINYQLRPGFRWLAILVLLLPSPVIYGDQETFGDLSVLQQDSRWLKATIEHLKLQRELAALRPLSGSTQKICQPGDSLGSLVLRSVYQENHRYYATFSYYPDSQVTAHQGERLPCGEQVLKITLDGVELQKQGQRYKLSGQVATLLTHSPLMAADPSTSQGVSNAER